MKALILLLSTFISFAISAQNTDIGVFQTNADIGNPKKTGSAIYNKTDQSYITERRWV